MRQHTIGNSLCNQWFHHKFKNCIIHSLSKNVLICLDMFVYIQKRFIHVCLHPKTFWIVQTCLFISKNVVKHLTSTIHAIKMMCIGWVSNDKWCYRRHVTCIYTVEFHNISPSLVTICYSVQNVFRCKQTYLNMWKRF